jgi:uncharacterized membrane protein YgdD (TMEM256/DUF423 family)
MSDRARAVGLAAAILSLSAVILAALGSHLVDMNGMQGIWQTALITHLFNAAGLMGLAGLLAVAGSPPLRWGAWLIVLGTTIFCGSIYLHVITGYTVPKVTPSGGLLMMTGWALVVLGFLRKS